MPQRPDWSRWRRTDSSSTSTAPSARTSSASRPASTPPRCPTTNASEREERFRSADLPVLYCSPTMELGVDISQLNVVNMRNVPPTPANYAQRSGRAGRSGQPALVFTYCAAGSNHDQHYFRQPERMVAGQVEAPRLDLANEDLLRAHVHAVWLAESGLDLGRSIERRARPGRRGRRAAAVPVDPCPPRRRLGAGTSQGAGGSGARRPRRARRRGPVVVGRPGSTRPSPPSRPASSSRSGAGARCTRRRCSKPTSSSGSSSRPAGRPVTAGRPTASAARPRTSWSCCEPSPTTAASPTSTPTATSPRRASCPGYSFPRLPLSAFIPGRRGRRDEPEYVQRPRFLAISEFGPQSLIYHEGARYRINRVILPVGDLEGDGGTLVTSRAKRCDNCGYLHPIPSPPGPDVCERCGAQLPPALDKLFRLQNVSTVRRDRITSDEEERQRKGYELISGVHFARRHGRALGRRGDGQRRRHAVAASGLRRHGHDLAGQPRLAAPPNEGAARLRARPRTWLLGQPPTTPRPTTRKTRCRSEPSGSSRSSRTPATPCW